MSQTSEKKSDKLVEKDTNQWKTTQTCEKKWQTSEKKSQKCKFRWQNSEIKQLN